MIFEKYFLLFLGLVWVVADIFNIYSIIHNKAREEHLSLGFLIVFAILFGPFCLGYTLQLFQSGE